jgi:translation initiation factor 4G
MVGTLLALLIKENHLSLEKFQHGLLEVLEIVDDLEVDIPKVWDFLTEIMFQLIKDDSIQLLNYVDLLKEIQIGKKLSQVIAKFLRYYNTATSSSAVSELWSTSNLQWVDLQLSSDQVESFINQENLTFISFTNLTSDLSHSPDDPPYLKDLSLLFASQNSTNDDIVDWIENHIKIEEIKSTTFIKTLARAVVCGSTSGDGNNCIYNEENFRNRLLLLKKWVDEDEKLQGVVLDGVQVGVTLLKHPPSMHKQLPKCAKMVMWVVYN